MELKDLEERREEIKGFIEENNKKLEKMREVSQKLNADYNTVLDQQKINYGALGEVNSLIAKFKKNDKETENIEVEKEKVENKK